MDTAALQAAAAEAKRASVLAQGLQVSLPCSVVQAC